MSPGEIRSRGVVALVVGVGLAAIAVPASVALLPAGGRSVPLLVICLLLCFYLAAAGALALWVVDAESVVRLRRWFVVLEGAVLVSVYPLLWSMLPLLVDAETVGAALGVAAFSVSLGVAVVFGARVSRAVHVFVKEVTGSLVPGDGSGVQAQRIRSLGTLLVVVGAAVAVSALPLTLTLPVSVARAVYFALPMMVAAICPVVLGIRLMRVTDVYSARRVNPSTALVVAGGASVMTSSPVFGVGDALQITVSGIVFGVLLLVVVALLVIAVQTWIGYTGVRDRPWQERMWGRAPKNKVSR